MTINYTSDNYEITIDSADGPIDASGYDLTMIDSIGGVSITSIGDGAFSSFENYPISCDILTLPSGLTSIGANAFENCNKLTSIDLPSELEILGEGAFYMCSGLTSIDLPSRLNSIAISVFDSCTGLTNITLPSGLTRIENQAFWGCSGLTSITLPSGLTKIGTDAFYDCSGLTSIALLGGLKNIGESAFDGCSNINLVDLSRCDTDTVASWGSVFNNLPIDTEWLIPYTTDITELVEWTDTIKAISGKLPYSLGFNREASYYVSGDSLSGNIKVVLADQFDPSSALTIIGYDGFEANNWTIKNDVNIDWIASNAFTDNTNLTGSLTIPESISIEANAFSGCSGINMVDLSSCSAIPTIWQNQCFDGVGANFLVPSTVTSTTLSEWYNAVGNWSSSEAPNVCIKHDAKNYSTGATNGTFMLKFNDVTGASLTLLDGTNVVATDLVINSDSGITNINDGAFQNDKNLSGSVDIPTDITTIGANVFNGCSNLNEIRLNWTNLSSINALNINQDWLGDLNNSNTTILVPVGTVDAYQAVASSWGMDQCNITDGVVPPGPTPPTPTDNNLNLGIALGVSLGICVGIPGIIGLCFLIDYKTKEKKQNKQE